MYPPLLTVLCVCGNIDSADILKEVKKQIHYDALVTTAKMVTQRVVFSYSSGTAHRQRDAQSFCILKTPLQTGATCTMYRFDIKGYCLNPGAALDVTFVGYTRGGFSNNNQYVNIPSPHLRLQQYWDDNGFLTLKFGPVSAYCANFNVLFAGYHGDALNGLKNYSVSWEHLTQKLLPAADWLPHTVTTNAMASKRRVANFGFGCVRTGDSYCFVRVPVINDGLMYKIEVTGYNYHASDILDVWFCGYLSNGKIIHKKAIVRNGVQTASQIRHEKFLVLKFGPINPYCLSFGIDFEGSYRALSAHGEYAIGFVPQDQPDAIPTQWQPPLSADSD